MKLETAASDYLHHDFRIFYGKLSRESPPLTASSLRSVNLTARFSDLPSIELARRPLAILILDSNRAFIKESCAGKREERKRGRVAELCRYDRRFQPHILINETSRQISTRRKLQRCAIPPRSGFESEIDQRRKIAPRETAGRSRLSEIRLPPTCKVTNYAPLSSQYQTASRSDLNGGRCSKIGRPIRDKSGSAIGAL